LASYIFFFAENSPHANRINRDRPARRTLAELYARHLQIYANEYGESISQAGVPENTGLRV